MNASLRLVARRCLGIVLTAALLGGCASSEGGPVGSGITSFVAGNVLDVQLDAASGGETAAARGLPAAGTAVPAVIVAIAEAGLETTTAEDGSFELSGEIAGPVTVDFRNPADRELLGQVSLDVPPGATVFLRDVEIRRDLDVPVLQPDPLVLNFTGDITASDCSLGLVRIRASGGDGREIVVRVGDGDRIVDRGGNVLTCASLRPGDRVALEEGVAILDANLIDAVRLVVDPARRPEPERPEFPATRAGVLLRADCERGRLFVQDDRHGDLVPVLVGGSTRFTCGADATPCACSDLAVGDRVEVGGVRRRGDLDLLHAETVAARPNPEGFVIERLSGDVSAVDCEAGILEIFGIRLAMHHVDALDRLRVRLSESTAFTCRTSAADTCSCGDIRLRDRVELQVLVPLDAPEEPPEALEVIVLASPVVRIDGTVDGVSCGRGTIELVTAPGEKRTLELLFSTAVRTRQGDTLACGQLGRGMRVVVAARLAGDPAVPALVADEIVVVSAPPPTPTPAPVPDRAFRAGGRVAGVDCRMGRRGLLLVVAGGEAVRVRITRDTKILRGRQPVGCSGIRKGEAATVDGELRPHPMYDVVADTVVLQTVATPVDGRS